MKEGREREGERERKRKRRERTKISKIVIKWPAAPLISFVCIRCK